MSYKSHYPFIDLFEYGTKFLYFFYKNVQKFSRLNSVVEENTKFLHVYLGMLYKAFYMFERICFLLDYSGHQYFGLRVFMYLQI
jgi:hypothetical protein